MPKRLKSINEYVLLALAAGLFITSPYSGQVLLKAIQQYLRRKYGPGPARITTSDIDRALYNFKRRQILESHELPDGTIHITLSERGRKRYLRYQLDQLKIKRPKRWDRKWRLVVFDIPEKIRLSRDAIRRKLEELGFLQLQKSVWIYPFECKDELDFLAELFEIGPHVLLIHGKIEDDLPLRTHFNLKYNHKL